LTIERRENIVTASNARRGDVPMSKPKEADLDDAIPNRGATDCGRGDNAPRPEDNRRRTYPQILSS